VRAVRLLLILSPRVSSLIESGYDPFRFLSCLVCFSCVSFHAWLRFFIRDSLRFSRERIVISSVKNAASPPTAKTLRASRAYCFAIPSRCPTRRL
jgi:hypothetical protein